MAPDELAQQIIEEARLWLGTPYRHRGRHLHQAVDCIGLVFGVAKRCGIGSEAFWQQINQEYATYRRVPDGFTLYGAFSRWLPEYPKHQAKPGDTLLISFAGAPRHTAILTDKNTIIHAHSEAKGCVENEWNGDWYRDTTTAFRLTEFREDAWQS